jgi:malate dehydrogenase (oxaloacetate-decarboxylating)
MWWDGKIQRTLRCRLAQKPGSLGRLLTAVGAEGGLIGEILSVYMGASAVDRDIVVFADDLNHVERIVRVVAETEGVRLLEVRDGVLEMHQGGKIAIRSRYDISSLSILRRVYTPGVAEVSLKIRDDPSLARRSTSIRHLVAIVTDGTAVLGLGDIGPKAAMPVMEGKASLLETLTGLSGMPILLDTKDPDAIVETVAHIAPPFAAIQLEDISAACC